MDPITVTTEVRAPLAKVWLAFTDPESVKEWNTASDDWHTTKAENEVRTGGTFSYRMEVKDGSAGFDFTGVYDEVVPEERIVYTMEDGRRVEVSFMETNDGVRVTETFDPESENTPELQRTGWQAILDRFKQHVERV